MQNHEMPGGRATTLFLGGVQTEQPNASTAIEYRIDAALEQR
jgi:hypothetical protein